MNDIISAALERGDARRRVLRRRARRRHIARGHPGRLGRRRGGRALRQLRHRRARHRRRRLGVRVLTRGHRRFGRSGRSQAVAIARASALRRRLPPWCWLRSSPQRGTWSSTCAIDPFAVSLEDKLAPAHRSRRGPAHSARGRHHQGAPRLLPRAQVVRLDRRRAHRAVRGRVRRRDRRLRHRRRRGALALLPQLTRRRLVAGRLGVHRSASTSSATRRASPSRPPRCSRHRTSSPARATSSSTAARWRCRCTSRSATPPSSTACWARRRRSRARRSCGSTTSARCSTARRIVTVTSDSTVPGSLGSFGWDDEGVPAQRDYLVRDGILAGFQSSRETAPVDRPREQRLHARRRLEPHPARPHDHGLARARARGTSTT